jgi:hypothetical protein
VFSGVHLTSFILNSLYRETYCNISTEAGYFVVDNLAVKLDLG